MALEREINMARSAHEGAKAAAVQKLPKIDVNLLISISSDLLTKNIGEEEIKKKYGDVLCDAAKTYAMTFTSSFVEEMIRSLMNSSEDDAVHNLAEGEYPKQIAAVALSAGVAVADYFRNEIDQNELMSRLANCGAKDAVETFFAAKGIEIKGLDKIIDAKGLNIEEIKKILASNGIDINDIENLIMTADSAVAFAALTEAYKILMSALNEAALQHEEMLQVKKQCDESAELIRRYRMDLEERASAYFESNYDTLEQGLLAMDRAVIDSDSDGYLKGNSMILNLLNHEVQFSSQEEFNNLMDSDIDLIL